MAQAERSQSEVLRVQSSARHGQLRRSSGWANFAKIILTGFIAIALSGVSVAAYAVWSVYNEVDMVQIPTLDNDDPDAIGAGSRSIDGALTILLVGSDSRAGSILDDGEQGELNDVNLLLHVTEDHESATIISFPRDLKLAIPSCPSEDGVPNYYSAMSEQMLNSAISYGGLPCVALTISQLTGLSIPYAALVTFDGVIGVSNAIGGVTVCLTEPINDPYTGLALPAGDNTLMGVDALQFLRTRYGVGSGGDTSRISNQQMFMSALVRQLQEEDTLSNPLRVFSLAKAGVENMTLSSNMASVEFMQALAGTVRDIDLDRINFVQFPSYPHPYEPNRLVPDYDTGRLLMDVVMSGEPFEIAATGEGIVEAGGDDTPSGPGGSDGTGGDGTDGSGSTGEGPGTTTEPGGSTDGGSTDDTPETIVLPGNITGQSASSETCSAGRVRW